MNQTTQLEDTLSALEKLPAEVALEWAVGTLAALISPPIGGVYWQDQFQGATNSETQNIAKNLAELRHHLLERNLDARAIGALLVWLREGTTVAPKAGENLRRQLEHLRAVLTAGERLERL